MGDVFSRGNGACRLAGLFDPCLAHHPYWRRFAHADKFQSVDLETLSICVRWRRPLEVAAILPGNGTQPPAHNRPMGINFMDCEHFLARFQGAQVNPCCIRSAGDRWGSDIGGFIGDGNKIGVARRLYMNEVHADSIDTASRRAAQ